MDAAALALNVDSSKVVQAANDLERFSTAADRAGASASKVNFGGASGSIAKLVASVQSIDGKLSALIGTVEKLSAVNKAVAASNDNVATSMSKADAHVTAYTQHLAAMAAAQKDANAHVLAYRNHLSTLPPALDNAAKSAGALQSNTGNIAAQFQDIGVTAAMGMNPLIIGLQQGTQLSAVFAQSGGSMAAVLKGAFLQIASAQALMTIGLVAAVAALIQLVDWAKLAQSALTGIADLLPKVADAVVYLGAVLLIAFAPQIISAILTMISTIGVGLVNAMVAATKAMITFAAANPFAALVIAVGLAVAAIWAFNDDISKVLGFNVLAVVKRAANFVIGSFVGAFHDIQFVWKNLPAVMGAAAIGATNAVIRSINWLLERGTAGINALIDGANKGLNALGISSIGHVGAPQLAQMANAAADGLRGAIGARNSQLQKDLSTDYIGMIGGAIDSATKWAQSKLRGLAGSIGAETAKKTKGSDDAANATKQAKVPWAVDIPIIIDPQMNLTDLPKLDAIKPIETAMTRLYEGMKAAREVTRGFLSEWINGIREGGNIFRTFADSVVNALNRIIDKLLDKTLDSFLNSMFTGTGGGGFLGSIFNSLGLGGGNSLGGVSASSQAYLDGQSAALAAPRAFANGGAFTNQVVNTPTLFRFAKGTQLGEMGEAGPEAIMPLARGPNGKLGVQMHGGGGAEIRMGDYNPTFSFAGAVGLDGIASMVRQGGEATYNQMKRDLQSLLQQLDMDGTFAS